MNSADDCSVVLSIWLTKRWQPGGNLNSLENEKKKLGICAAVAAAVEALKNSIAATTTRDQPLLSLRTWDTFMIHLKKATRRCHNKY